VDRESNECSRFWGFLIMGGAAILVLLWGCAIVMEVLQAVLKGG
jgi:hypothetical protein